MTVDYEVLLNDLRSFLTSKKRKGDWRVQTSSMENNTYHKEYVFENGDIFYEVISIEHEVVYATCDEVRHGIQIHRNIPVEVEFQRVEYWSSDDSKSKYYYEVIS